MIKIVLYLTAKIAEHSHEVTGEIKFNWRNITPYSCKINRGIVTNLTLLNERKLNINDHMPSVFFKEIRRMVPLALCKSKTNPELFDLSKYTEGTITWKMYSDANREMQGESSVVVISQEEFEPLFNEVQKLLPQYSKKYLAATGS